jgi:hypothetical protein
MPNISHSQQSVMAFIMHPPLQFWYAANHSGKLIQTPKHYIVKVLSLLVVIISSWKSLTKE